MQKPMLKLSIIISYQISKKHKSIIEKASKTYYITGVLPTMLANSTCRLVNFNSACTQRQDQEVRKINQVLKHHSNIPNLLFKEDDLECSSLHSNQC